MHTTYKCTGSRNMPLTWRCSNCRNLIFATYRITATASSRNKNNAEELMHSLLEDNALNAVLDVENRRFDRVRFKSKCPNCGNIPSWSNLPGIPPKVLIILRNLALAAAVVLALSSISSKPSRQEAGLYSLVAAALFTVLALVCLLIRHKMLKEKASALDALPFENRPWLAPTVPELKQRLTEKHIFTTEEINALGNTGSSVINSGQNLSHVYRIKAERLKAEDRSRQIRSIVITAIALTIFFCFQFNNVQSAGWEEKMEKANLFAVNPQAGNKFVVQEKLHNSEAKFVKKYLMPEWQATKPEEVGFIIIIEDSTEIVATYNFIRFL